MISWVSNHRFMVNSVFLDIKFTINFSFPYVWDRLI
uniref:Uncharacterized protein n=1 Tax=Myoviridae sp. ctcyQ27 TaxID=2825139 RepID=A0A8S5UFD0_9CAUD|nr:MAG TPA: hypothetical protein [Myoviridae sp. ctcyQ27]